jgi:prepilin-type processing-associated H-X9-DG protein
MPSLDALAPRSGLWQGRHASRASHGILQANAVDASLYRLRDRALAAIKGMDFSHLPRRFYAGRLPGQARNRAVRGEAELLDMLALFDIQPVAFESLSPFEQIGLMANAELMVAPHGAGFANMLFADPAATVVELGTLQTGMYRWGDF